MAYLAFRKDKATTHLNSNSCQIHINERLSTFWWNTPRMAGQSEHRQRSLQHWELLLSEQCSSMSPTHPTASQYDPTTYKGILYALSLPFSHYAHLTVRQVESIAMCSV